MRIALPVTPDGAVNPGFGKASLVAVVAVTGGNVTDWTAHEVGWDIAHDLGTEGAHHARIVRFLREHEVTHVLFAGMGAPMQNTINKMGITLLPATRADARQAVEQAITIATS